MLQACVEQTQLMQRMLLGAMQHSSMLRACVDQIQRMQLLLLAAEQPVQSS
jgi:hypothetical protein